MNGMAQEKKDELKFFKDKVEFFNFGQGCEECEEETEPQKTISTNKPATPKSYKILLFLSLEDGEKNKKVVQEIRQFVQRNQEFEVEGYLIDRIKNFKELALQNSELFDNTFTFNFEPNMETAIKMRIKQVPFVIVQDTSGKEITRFGENFWDNLVNFKTGKVDKKGK